VCEAFALAIIAGGEGPAYPGIAGHEPNVPSARQRAAAIEQAMKEVRQLAANAGAYVSESDFFEKNWQQSFWGANYPRLIESSTSMILWILRRASANTGARMGLRS
jgi:hypothetical protein